jgi:hypothetical protein
LRRKKAAPGRVWLLLRAADAAGRGCVSAAEAARLLTGDGSPYRICGRRQLANLLAAGDGLFWERNAGRTGEEQLWLRSAARVAAGLGVARLNGSPVAVPLAALSGTIGQARAHLYASFHSGRQRADLLTGRPRPRGPIARGTLCKLTGASLNSQRNYERRAAVGRKSAIAIGPLAGAADEHEVAWRRGRALFHLRDDAGRFGRPGAVYLAWQLPNEYTGPHAALPRGRQKRLNRALADLFHDGMTGNGEPELRVTSDELRVTSQEARRSAASGSVGQWVSGQWSVVSRLSSVVGGQRSGATTSSGSELATRHSSFVARHYYGSAKAAFLARGGYERYWRYGAVWLWQPELRVTSYELRVKNIELQTNSTFTTCDLPPATGSTPLNSSLVTRHSSFVTRHSKLFAPMIGIKI